jgi:predicted phage terminase large subunit-like protein
LNDQENILSELAEQRRQACLNSVASLYFFYRLCWDIISNEEFIDNWHIKYICDELQEVGLRIVRREANPYDLIINIPPGMSKSSIASQVFPVWLWLQDPSIVVISTSYSSDLAIDNSLKSKTIFKSQLFYEYFQEYFKKTFGHYIRLVKDLEKDWRNNFGGARISVGTGGTITGRHAHVIIPDDPISVDMAESEAHRKRVNRYMNRTLPSRKVDKKMTPTIMIMQRLHDDDPTGNALQSGKVVKHICLPAELSGDVNPPELRGKYINGLLDPRRLDRETLAKQKTELGSYGYAGQYEQTPVPEGGGKIKKEWFGYLDEVLGVTWDLWIDGAYTEETKNDPTGLAIIGHDKKNNRIIVKHAISKFLGLPELLKFIPEYMADQGVTINGAIFVEPKASGLSIIQMLKVGQKNDVIKITGYLVSGGKEARINCTSPKAESGKIFLLHGNWNDEFLHQLTGYPNAKHDEFVDILGYATQRYLIAGVEMSVDWD